MAQLWVINYGLIQKNYHNEYIIEILISSWDSQRFAAFRLFYVNPKISALYMSERGSEFSCCDSAFSFLPILFLNPSFFLDLSLIFCFFSSWRDFHRALPVWTWIKAHVTKSERTKEHWACRPSKTIQLLYFRFFRDRRFMLSRLSRQGYK